MVKSSTATKNYPTKQIAQQSLAPGELADTGGETINRMTNQYGKEPPENDSDFMSAFMGKGRFS